MSFPVADIVFLYVFAVCLSSVDTQKNALFSQDIFFLLLDIEAEMQHIAILHDVSLFPLIEAVHFLDRMFIF